MFTYPAFNGSVGPSFQWNILNYGRIGNNVRLQDAKFQQTLLDYRTAVLTANQEAEDGLVTFLLAQEGRRSSPRASTPPPWPTASSSPNIAAER